MKLSFVIPAYNEERDLGPCLDSILRELKGKPFDTEIVVVNNASTDRTKEVARQYPQVRVVDEEKKGIVWARRAGYLASTGELIANVDADTTLTQGWVLTVFREFEKNPNLVCLSGPQICPDLPWYGRVVTWIYWRFFGMPFYFLVRFVFRVGSIVQGGNFIVRRDAMNKVGGYNTNIVFWGEDTDIGMRLYRVGVVKFTLGLPINASGRRLMQEGMAKTALRYALNNFWVIFFGKPYPLNKASVDVRYKKH